MTIASRGGDRRPAGPDAQCRIEIPFDADEYRTAGGWQRTPLRLARAKTVPLDIPADAEFIIEGHVLPHVRNRRGRSANSPTAMLRWDGAMSSRSPSSRGGATRSTTSHRRQQDTVLLGVPLMTEVLKKIAPLAKIRDLGFPGHIRMRHQPGEDRRRATRAVSGGGARRA